MNLVSEQFFFIPNSPTISFWHSWWLPLALIIPIIFGFWQWRSQFIQKMWHDAAAKFLEKLSILKGFLQDYRRPGFNKNNEELNRLWKEVHKAYIETNIAFESLKIVIPPQKIQIISKSYSLIRENVVNKMSGIHDSYCRDRNAEEKSPQEYIEILFTTDSRNVSNCNQIYTILKEKPPKAKEQAKGNIYIYGKNEQFFSFKEHIFGEIFTGYIDYSNADTKHENIIQVVTKSEEGNGYDIFGKIIDKYFSNLTEQCQKDFFIHRSSKWLRAIGTGYYKVVISLKLRIRNRESPTA